MTTLQEQFEKDFPDKSMKWIDAEEKYQDSNFTNYDLDLREYVNLKWLDLTDIKITSINLSGWKKFKKLYLSNNNLISLDLTNNKKIDEQRIQELENKITQLENQQNQQIEIPAPHRIN